MTPGEAAVELLASGDVLLGVDFDGVLAPLVDHPDLAVPEPRALMHLRTLASRPGVHVAVVSGRSLEDLKARLGDIPEATLVGEHGNDTGEGDPDGMPRNERIAEAHRFMETLRGDREIAVETKPRSVTFHTRTLGDAEKREAACRIREWAGVHTDVTLLEGKEVLELTVASRTKGDVIQDLAKTADSVIYIGDDTTDETVFAVLGHDDIGVKVGPGPTAARFRVPDVAAVADLLEMTARSGG